MTDEDLRYKPGVVKQTKFENSSLAKAFDKGLEEDEEELLKRLKNVAGKNEEQLKAIKDQEEKQLNILSNKQNKEANLNNLSFKNKLDFESNKVSNDIKEQNKKNNYAKLVCNGSGNHYHNFTIFLTSWRFTESIYSGNLSLEAEKIKQRNTENMIKHLNN